MAISRRSRWLLYAVAAVLTLIAVRWAGGDERTATDAQPPARAERSERPARADGAAAETAPDVNIEKLPRRAHEAPGGDLFKPNSWQAIAQEEARKQAPPPPPPPKPTAPPLPFKYLGKLVEDERTLVFLVRDDRNFIVRAGDTIEGTYRVDEIAEQSMTFTFLPLKERQVLALGGQN
jgi:hypothetical protein